MLYLTFTILVLNINTTRILPGDNLLIFLRLRKQLYISLDDGRAVLNNSILDENSIDTALPTSIRRIDNVSYAIIVDGARLCSYGIFRDIAECVDEVTENDQWIFTGTDEEFTIQGKGGCITRYYPESTYTDFKHGLRIEFCDENDNQKFMIQRLLYNMV